MLNRVASSSGFEGESGGVLKAITEHPYKASHRTRWLCLLPHARARGYSSESRLLAVSLFGPTTTESQFLGAVFCITACVWRSTSTEVLIWWPRSLSVNDWLVYACKECLADLLIVVLYTRVPCIIFSVIWPCCFTVPNRMYCSTLLLLFSHIRAYFREVYSVINFFFCEDIVWLTCSNALIRKHASHEVIQRGLRHRPTKLRAHSTSIIPSQLLPKGGGVLWWIIYHPSFATHILCTVGEWGFVYCMVLY